MASGVGRQETPKGSLQCPAYEDIRSPSMPAFEARHSPVLACMKLRTQECPQYCWEFHDNSSERASPEPILKREAFPAALGGENSGNALEASNALNYRVWGHPSRTLEGNSRKRSESVSGVFPEFFQKFFREVPAVLGVWPKNHLSLGRFLFLFLAIHRHLQECPTAWAGKFPTQCFWVLFGHLTRRPQRVLFECFCTFRAKNAKKHSKSTLWGPAGASLRKHLKSTLCGTFRPGPLGTPANGGQDHNPISPGFVEFFASKLDIFLQNCEVLPSQTAPSPQKQIPLKRSPKRRFWRFR